MYDVLTTIVGYPGQRCDVWSIRNGLCRPATGINGGDAALELQLAFYEQKTAKCTNRSFNVITVGPLLSMISSSEWMPTKSSLPSLLACSIAPACPKFNKLSVVTNLEDDEQANHDEQNQSNRQSRSGPWKS